MQTTISYPVRVLYVIGLIAAGIFMIPLIWYGFHYAFGLIQPISKHIAENLNTNGTLYDQVDTFFLSVDYWLPVIGILALIVFCIVYAQRRGQAT